jgi:hypothetical protein
MLIQASVGAGIAGLCWYRQRNGWSERTLLTSTLAMVCAWMMLLGPSTETSSFALVAPSLAWSVVDELRRGRWTLRGVLLGCCCAIFVVAIALASARATLRISELGVHSWASLLYLLYVLSESQPFLVVALPRIEPLRRAA